jgi:hypothetical protein
VCRKVGALVMPRTAPPQPKDGGVSPTTSPLTSDLSDSEEWEDFSRERRAWVTQD